MNLLDALRRALVANELGGHTGLAYRFSDPDGPGRSGYSFGLCQFDLRHNRMASQALLESGFSPVQVEKLVNQTCTEEELSRYNAALGRSPGRDFVDRLDSEELVRIVIHVAQVISNAGLALAGEEVFIHLADYHNQYRLDFGGKAVRHFRPFGRTITAADVLEYKLATAWGQKRPDDVKRRWNNIVKICREDT